MIVGLAGKTEELSIIPLQFLFGKSVKGSLFGGTMLTLKQFVNLNQANALPSFFLFIKRPSSSRRKKCPNFLQGKPQGVVKSNRDARQIRNDKQVN